MAWLLLLPATGFGSSGPAVHAASRPYLSWAFPSNATADEPMAFSWSASRLRPGSRLVVQRQEGTASAWHTIVGLKGSGGSASLPGLPMGRYRLRLASLGNHHAVFGQREQLVTVFGAVPLSTLFPHNNSGIYTTPTNTFPYLYNFPRSATAAITASHNNCRSMHLEFVPGVNYVYPEDRTESGTLTVVQETQDPASVTTPYNTLATLNVTLVPGRSWSINLSPNGKDELGYYFNGSADCYSTEPAAP
ncbi:MAG: hypothetical protein ACRDK2_01530 [Solirubrobacteraceae bacterium]